MAVIAAITAAITQYIITQSACLPACLPAPPHAQADMSDFAAVNAIYGRFFPENPPARATFAVKGLPLGAVVEIEATALL